MASADVSARMDDQMPRKLPRFMPPVTLSSFEPHPFLPLQPDRSQFILQPDGQVQASRPPPAAPRPTALHEPKDILIAAKSGNLEWVQRYCLAGQTERIDGLGETALLKASEFGHTQIAEYLIKQADANVSHTDTDGWTALHNAAASGHLDIVQLLVTTGKADINAQSHSTGYTPLMNAASRGHRVVLDFLMTLPAVDWSIRNVQSESLYDIAAGKGDLSTCECIETYEREHLSRSHRDVQYDSTSQHTVIPRIVIESARVNSRSLLPDSRLLTGSIDPPQFAPVRKEDISLPRSSDISSNWIWISKWTVFRADSESGSNGWKFAQRWDAPQGDWVGNATILTPISRAGLVARRTWFRVMKRCPVGQDYLGEIETSETEVSESEISPAPVGISRTATERSVPSSQGQSVRANSMGARLVGLVTGSAKDLNETDVTEHAPDVADESEVDDVFSTHGLTMTTATPASSVYEGLDMATINFTPELENNGYQEQPSSQCRGHHTTHGSSSSQYPRRNAGRASTSFGDGQHGSRPVQDERPGGDGSNDGEGNPGGTRAIWEPDENVSSCGLCRRRFTAFLRRHHCRFCGRVVCYRCSGSRQSIPADHVVLNPYLHTTDDLHDPLHRVCDICVPVLQQLAASGSSREPPRSAVPSITIPTVADMPQTLGTANPEMDDRHLVECPVCRADLRQFGDEDLQAIHVATCLEGHSMSPTFNGGSRHLVYRLQEGSPLIGAECVICFEEFKAGERISRTDCLCNFHRRCFRDWIQIGNGCPVHFLRS